MEAGHQTDETRLIATLIQLFSSPAGAEVLEAGSRVEPCARCLISERR